MTNDKKTEYKVNYIFNKNSKININEVIKKIFLISLETKTK